MTDTFPHECPNCHGDLSWPLGVEFAHCTTCDIYLDYQFVKNYYKKNQPRQVT